MRKLSMTALVALSLVLAACGGDGSTSEEALVGPTWHFTEFLGGDDEVVTPDDPASYTVTFNEDGAVTVKADCNNVLGTFEENAPQLEIVLGPTTLVACEDGSIGDRFSSWIGNTVSYVFDGGDLVISLFADAGTLRFEAGH